MAQRSAVFALVLLVSVLAPASIRAQSPPTGDTQQETAALAEGWAMLARGQVAEAAAHAAMLGARYPNSTAVLALSVEAEIARAGAMAGLTQYERWLGQKPLEEPGTLRRLALAALREVAGSSGATGRIEALRALAADGDAAAIAELGTSVSSAMPAEARVLAALGDERGVKAVVASLGAGSPSLESIRVLGESGHPLALDALLTQAQAGEPAVRQAAMAALGHFDDRRAVAELKQGLSDQFGLVRGQAAGALYRLGDNSGLSLLNDLAASDSPMGRLAAAQYLSSRPDARWLGLVRELSAAGQPNDVRLAAANLLAPHDPDEAASILRTLGSDPSVDLAVREEAVRAQPAAARDDVRRLRGLLRTQDALVRVAAAEQLLNLTR